MKTKTFKAFGTAIFFGGLVFGAACSTTQAQDSSAVDSAEHSKHHPEQSTPKTKKTENSNVMKKDSSMMGGNMMNNGMMEKMDMNQMMGMMHQCMAAHKDGKMCDHQMMEKCQVSMDKNECMKMMDDAKKQSKAKK